MTSPGCARCYAETMAKRIAGMARADKAAGRNPGRKEHYLNVLNDKGRWNGKVELVPEALADPLTWSKPRRVFVNSMSDLFHEGVPFDFVDSVFAVMALCPQHTFQVLTKRPERMAEYFNAEIPLSTRADCVAGMHPTRIHGRLFTWGEPMKPWLRGAADDPYDRRPWPGWPLPNVWLGTSVEDQQRADERIPHLTGCHAAVRFLSCEPLLGEIDLHCLDRIDWVIVGGESGGGARPCNVQWIRSIVRQCRTAGVACFVKQMGSRIELPNDTAREWGRDGDVLSWESDDVHYQGEEKIARLEDHKGGDPSEWPEDLRVREFPAAREQRA